MSLPDAGLGMMPTRVKISSPPSFSAFQPSRIHEIAAGNDQLFAGIVDQQINPAKY